MDYTQSSADLGRGLWAVPRPVFLADLSILSRRQIRSNHEIRAIDIMDQSLAQNLSRLRVGDSGTPTMSARTDDEATQVQVSSGITPDTLKYRLIEKLDATHVQIEDMSGNHYFCYKPGSLRLGFEPQLPENPRNRYSCFRCIPRTLPGRNANIVNYHTGGCGQMFEAIIVSPQFAKKTTLARHRLVNNTLKEEIAAIHAWTPKCHTPEEWEKKKAQA